MKVIDAEGAKIGRTSSKIAKKLLKGERVEVINTEKSIITGKKPEIVKKYRQKLNRSDKANPTKGPHYPKTPERIFKRTIRGMLPYTTKRGKKAMKKLKVYLGNPDNKKGEKIHKEYNGRKITLKELSKELGWTSPKEAK